MAICGLARSVEAVTGHQPAEPMGRRRVALSGPVLPMVVLFVILGGILALASFISGWPWNFLG